ncbi:MAG: SdpI family protein [Halobacteriales archaeon]
MTLLQRFRRPAAGIAVALVAAAISAVFAPELPAEMVTTWSASGEPTGAMSRSTVLVGGPAMVLFVVALFEVIPRIDPLAANIRQFQAAYDAAAVVVAGFLAYVHALVVVWNLGHEFDLVVGLAPALSVLYVAVGFLLERAERNWFVGIRTPWTLSSERVWRDTHDLAATLFKATGVVALGALVVPDDAIYFVVAPAVAVSLVGTVYSFVRYRQLGDGDPAEG